MLRIIVISLVLANLLLLGFQGSRSALQKETPVKQIVTEESNIPTIHLFSELVQDQELMTNNRRCFSLGPFHLASDVDDVLNQLLEVSATVSERQTRALIEQGYWVFLPPYESFLEANRVLFSLQALGLEDVAIIYDGDWKNAISLGYFLRQKNAVRRKKGLEERGYEPRMSVRRKTEPRYWLDYEQNPGSGLFALDMQDRPNDFMQRSLPCPEQDLFDIAVIEPQVTGDSEHPGQTGVEILENAAVSTTEGVTVEDKAPESEINTETEAGRR
jgi:hypothetical protein